MTREFRARLTDVETTLKNVERRTERMEQILPTLATREELREAAAPLATREELREAIVPLATKEELREAIAPLATKEELREAVAPLATKEELRLAIQAAIAPLATKAELKEEGERTRRHFDVVSERMRDEIRLIAEGHLATEAKFDRQRLEHLALERRVTKLEIDG